MSMYDDQKSEERAKLQEHVNAADIAIDIVRRPIEGTLEDRKVAALEAIALELNLQRQFLGRSRA